MVFNRGSHEANDGAGSADGSDDDSDDSDKISVHSSETVVSRSEARLSVVGEKLTLSSSPTRTDRTSVDPLLFVKLFVVVAASAANRSK